MRLMTEGDLIATLVREADEEGTLVVGEEERLPSPPESSGPPPEVVLRPGYLLRGTRGCSYGGLEASSKSTMRDSKGRATRRLPERPESDNDPSELGQYIHPITASVKLELYWSWTLYLNARSSETCSILDNGSFATEVESTQNSKQNCILRSDQHEESEAAGRLGYVCCRSVPAYTSF